MAKEYNPVGLKDEVDDELHREYLLEPKIKTMTLDKMTRMSETEFTKFIGEAPEKDVDDFIRKINYEEYGTFIDFWSNCMASLKSKKKKRHEKSKGRKKTKRKKKTKKRKKKKSKRR